MKIRVLAIGLFGVILSIGLLLLFNYLYTDKPTIVTIITSDNKKVKLPKKEAEKFQFIKRRMDLIKITPIELHIPVSERSFNLLQQIIQIPATPVAKYFKRFMGSMKVFSDKYLPIGQQESMTKQQQHKFGEELLDVVRDSMILKAPPSVRTWLVRFISFSELSIPSGITLVNFKQVVKDVAKMDYLFDNNREGMKTHPFIGFSIEDLLVNDSLNPILIPQKKQFGVIGQYLNSLTGLQKVPHIKGLTEFYFKDNRLKTIGPDVFKGLNVRLLDFSRNKISNIPKTSAAGLMNLRVLNLSYNSIKKLPLGLFVYIPELVSLNIDGNDVKELTTLSLAGLSKLKILKASANNIKSVADDMFAHIPDIQEIDLAFNQLDDSMPLIKLPKLKKLNLSQNKFSVAKKAAIRKFYSGITLSL